MRSSSWRLSTAESAAPGLAGPGDPAAHIEAIGLGPPEADPGHAVPSSRRMLLLLGGLSALGPASMDIYLPALPSVADDLGASASVAQLTIALFILGIAGGQLIAGPASDVFGRKRPLLVAICAFLVATLACSLAPSMPVLLGARLLQGLTAAAGIGIARAVVRDLYAGAAAARYLSRLVLVYGLAPVIAPLIGGQLLLVMSWRGVFLVMLGYALLLIAATAVLLPETLPPGRRRPLGVDHTVSDFRGLLRHRTFVGYALTLGIGCAAMAGYLASSPFILQDLYGVSPQVFAVIFGINAVAMIAASQVNAHLVERVDPRLILTVATLGMIAAGLFLLFSVLADLGLWGVLPCFMWIMISWGFVPANSIALAMAEHPQVAGSASALLGVSQYGIAALITPVVGLGGRTSALPMAILLIAVGVLSTFCLRVIALRRIPVHAVA